MSSDEAGFVQEYELGRHQELVIYCRLCRRTFPVAFKPRPGARLRCLCGHMAGLNELDVFRSEEAAREHASFYEGLYQAAKQALREAGMPIPHSGKWRLADGADGWAAGPVPSDEQQVDDEVTESSDLTVLQLTEFDDALSRTQDPLERHQILSELIEWAFLRRDGARLIRERLRSACREDIALSDQVVARVKELLRRGEKVRLTFTSFRHLALDLEEEGRLAEALEIVERARALGLKGYDERAARLRELIGEA